MNDTPRLRAALAAARNRDGGWPYSRGRASRLEPTAWALLALAELDRRPPDVHVLAEWPRTRGWLVDVERAPVNYAFNALAALTMIAAGEQTLAAPIASQLASARGVAVPQAAELRQDNSLEAWPWIEGTFSWVEPTAWCLLLLKKPQLRASMPPPRERIAVGERMLLDRACAVGGWNYGSPSVYGQELLPYVPTTALGLLALQDKPDHPTVVRSLTRLQEDVRTERSAMALALARLAFGVLGVPAAALDRELEAYAARLVNRLEGLDNIAGLAMVLYALSRGANPAAFSLST